MSKSLETVHGSEALPLSGERSGLLRLESPARRALLTEAAPSRRRARRAVLDRRLRLRFARLCILIGLVPLATAGVVLALAAGDTERQRAQYSLESSVHLAAVALAREVDAAAARAVAVAGTRSVQRALAVGDAPALERLAARDTRLSFSNGRGLHVGREAGLVERTAQVRSGNAAIGRVSVTVPLDAALLRRLEAQSATGGTKLLLRTAKGRPAVPAGTFPTVQVSGKRYVAYTLPVVRDGLRLIGITSVSRIDSRTATRRVWIAVGLLASLLAVGGLGYMIAPAAARPLRGPARRRATDRRRIDPTGRDVREMLTLVGDAFAATHDSEALLPVILEAMVEATSARGGRLLHDGRELVRGKPDRDTEPLVLELQVEGATESLLMLYPPPQGFSKTTRELARSLVAQAGTALENARLHTIVKRQAVTDDLTQLSNRRGFMEALELEVRRSERFGGALSLVLLDLDDFKRINDRHGHQTGDDVLVAVGETLKTRVRDVDFAARLGGEEFAVLLPHTDAHGARALAESLRSSIAAIRFGKERGVRVTASFGVATRREPESVNDLLHRADLGLYGAKERGKNRVDAYDDAVS
jgi:diguanylate cyclase (GGDEF)-like protein